MAGIARTLRQHPETQMPGWPWRGIRATSMAPATRADTVGRDTAGRDMAIGTGPEPPPTSMAKPQPWRSAWFRATRGYARASIPPMRVCRSGDCGNGTTRRRVRIRPYRQPYLAIGDLDMSPAFEPGEHHFSFLSHTFFLLLVDLRYLQGIRFGLFNYPIVFWR